MKKSLLILAALAATASVPATAAPITWTFGNLNQADGHHTFTQGSYTLDVYAYKTANNNGTGSFSSTPLQGWSGNGLGAGGESSSNGEHAVDSSGKNELLVFDFGAANYLATGFQLGWWTSDSDVDVWVGGTSGLNFSSLCFSGCAAGNALSDKGFTKFDFDNAGTGFHALNGSAGRYLVISVAASSGDNDKFKVLRIQGEQGTPPSEVPEPGSIALMALALVSLAAAQRRKAR